LARVPRRDQVPGDIDAYHVRSTLRRRYRRRPVAAAQVEDLEPADLAEALDHRVAALAHARGDPREVSLFPQRLIRIH
jgi:hypothetical protein